MGFVLIIIIFSIIFVDSYLVLASNGNGNSEPTIIEPTITKTASTDRICYDGKCTLTLWSGTKNVYEDGVWKRVEEAKSLKGAWNVVYLENDSAFNIIVNDFNISYMDMTLDFKGNPEDYLTFCQVTDELNAKCDFKLDEKWEEHNETTREVIEKSQVKFQYKWEIKNGEIIKGDKVKFEYKGNPFGKEFKFGGNSTTIKLDDAYDMADIYDYDTSINSESLMRWNITSIPDSSIIEDALLCLYITTWTTGSPDDDVTIDRILNQTWTESVNCAGIDAFTYDSQTNKTLSSITEESWTTIDTTVQVKADYDDNNDFASFVFEDQDAHVGSCSNSMDTYSLTMGSASNYFTFEDRENHDGTGNLPYLNITYSEAPDTCTCPGLNEDWEIDMSDYCNITTDCDLGTGYLDFTGTGATRCNATINTTNLGDPGSSGVLYMQDNCMINVFSS